MRLTFDVTPHKALNTLGWLTVGVFWLLLLMTGVLLASSQDAGLIIFYVVIAVGMTFPVLVVPIGIIAYGIWNVRGQSFWKALAKWSTIAMVVYIFCVVLLSKGILAQ